MTPPLQVRQITELSGLAHFRVDLKREVAPGEWRRWPHLAISLDQGSDGVAAYWWLQEVGVCLSAYWDFSHGAQNDWRNMLQDVDMFTFWILMMMVWNCPCGPLTDRTRWQMLLEGWHAMFSNFSASDCPLFLSKVQDILRDRGGLVGLKDGQQSIEEALWDELKGDPPFQAGSPKTNLTRFFSSVAKAREELGRWHVSLMNYEYVAPEESLLTSAKIKKMVLRPPLNGER